MKDLPLTEQVKSIGRELGLDLVGVCSVNSLPRLDLGGTLMKIVTFQDLVPSLKK